MWSRKKRKKEGKGSSGSAGKSRQQSSRPASMSPAVVRKPPPPNSMDTIETKLEDSDNLTEKTSTVPLTSPLTANILAASSR